MVTRTIAWQRRDLFEFKDDLEPKVTDDTKILIRTFSSAKIHELEHKRV